MSDAPPTRYQVVEQDRRLVVVDTWAGGGRPPAGVTMPTDAPPPSLFARTRRVRFDGGAVLTTHPWYDLKAPRTLRLDGTSAALTGAGRSAVFVIAAIIIGAVAFTPWVVIPVLWVGWNARSRVRRAITAWLDNFEAG